MGIVAEVNGTNGGKMARKRHETKEPKKAPFS